MKRNIICFLIISLTALTAETYAQEYKVPVQNTTDAKIKIADFTGKLLVEGYSGNEIILISGQGEIKVPEMAKGLTRVYPGGTDNTGLGVEFEKEGNVMSFYCQLPLSRMGDYTIKVPDNATIEIKSGCERNNHVIVRNTKSEIEIQNCQDIELENVSGPLILATLSGNIKITSAGISPDRPFSVNSISGDIDITLPQKTQADLEIKTISGAIYSDFDLSSQGKEMKQYGGNKIIYSLNGGGNKYSISSISGNIFLRKGN